MADDMMIQDPEAQQEQKPKVGETKTASVLFGIPQLGLTHVDRQVPVDEPPPLPENAELKYVGKPTVRYDGAAEGERARQIHGGHSSAGHAVCLHAGRRRSSWPHPLGRYLRGREAIRG